MFANLTFRFRSWLVLFVIPFLLFACAGDMEPKIPLPNGIPNDDIVFMPANPVVDVDINPNGKTMGFINDDGTNKVMYAFTMFGGTRSNFGMQLSNRVALYPRWSKSGTMLVFQIASTEPNTRMIDSDGRMYGKNCDAFVGGDFDAQGNILGEITQAFPLYSEYQNKVTANTTLVARYDIKTCTLVGAFSVPVSQKDSIASGTYEAENGLLIAGLYESTTDTFKVMIFDPMSKSFTSFPDTIHP